jgi:hypothetical protein
MDANIQYNLMYSLFGTASGCNVCNMAPFVFITIVITCLFLGTAYAPNSGVAYKGCQRLVGCNCKSFTNQTTIQPNSKSFASVNVSCPIGATLKSGSCASDGDFYGVDLVRDEISYNMGVIQLCGFELSNGTPVTIYASAVCESASYPFVGHVEDPCCISVWC